MSDHSTPRKYTVTVKLEVTTYDINSAAVLAAARLSDRNVPKELVVTTPNGQCWVYTAAGDNLYCTNAGVIPQQTTAEEASPIQIAVVRGEPRELYVIDANLRDWRELVGSTKKGCVTIALCVLPVWQSLHSRTLKPVEAPTNLVGTEIIGFAQNRFSYLVVKPNQK